MTASCLLFDKPHRGSKNHSYYSGHLGVFKTDTCKMANASYIRRPIDEEVFPL